MSLAYQCNESLPTQLTEVRKIKLTPEALKKLEELAQQLGEHGPRVGPLQVAALLVELAISEGALARRKQADDVMLAIEAEVERRAFESNIIEVHRRRQSDNEVADGESRSPRVEQDAA